MSARIERMTDEVSAALARLSRQFTSDAKLTFIARFDDNEEADVVVSDDDMSKVRALVDRTLERERGERPGYTSPESLRPANIGAKVV